MEVVNRTLEMYLRCMVVEHPHNWINWLPWVEYYYNTFYHSALQTTPFQLVYGNDSPRLLSYVPGTLKLDAVDVALVEWDQILTKAKSKLLLA